MKQVQPGVILQFASHPLPAVFGVVASWHCRYPKLWTVASHCSMHWLVYVVKVNPTGHTAVHAPFYKRLFVTWQAVHWFGEGPVQDKHVTSHS